MDYYSILGVPKNASEQDIRKAYKKQSMQHHPDRGGDEEQFKKVNEAYSTLKDPQKRQQYDNPQPQGFRGFNGPFNGTGFEDVFSNFGFGRQSVRNRDINIGCNLELKDVYTGKQIVVAYRLNNGKEQTVDLNIPIGVRQGDRIRFAQMGQHDIPQVPPGDLFVQINIMNTPEFEVHGLDLLMTRRVSVLKLITGTTIEIKTPNDSFLELKISKGTQPGTTLRLTGRGLPNRAGGQGSILVKVIGQTPSGLDQEDIEKIEQIEQKYS